MYRATDSKSKKTVLGKGRLGNLIIVLGLTMIIAGTYSYLFQPQKNTEAIAPPQEQLTIKPPIIEQPAVMPLVKDQPISKAVNSAPEIEEEEAIVESENIQPLFKLPLLDNSDPIALTAAQHLLKQEQYSQLLINQEIIRNFVVFVDNFSRGELLTNFSPLSAPSEPFSIVKIEREMYLNTESYQRYNIYAEMIEAIDIDFAIHQYRILKPLFDEAYQEIGYPDEAFESRLSAAIEMLLNTPIIDQSIALVAPSAMYKFADPDLEALPAAQKLLLRMGPENSVKIKAKLQQIENALQSL